jgi:SAM-dependent methyltransferase
MLKDRKKPVPLPPVEFAHRVGCPPGDDSMEKYVAIGQRMRPEILRLLPEGWVFDGRRVLDFGCGAGRLLRHFLREAEIAEFYGTDTDREMIGWLRANLCPPLAGAEVNGYAPPLRYPNAHFDLVLAISVFTHITDEWSAWLLEMHRILKPDGLMIGTFLGRGAGPRLVNEPWDEGRIGMNALGFAREAPFVLHSEWWLRAHWGRAFELLRFLPDGFTTQGRPNVGQGYVVLRPRSVESLTIEDLERDEPGEERYLEARRHHLRQLRADGEQVRAVHRHEIESLRGPRQR